MKTTQHSVDKSIDAIFKCAVSAESLQTLSRGFMLLFECMHELMSCDHRSCTGDVTLWRSDALHAGVITLIEVLGTAWQTCMVPAWCRPRQVQCASFARLDARSAPVQTPYSPLLVYPETTSALFERRRCQLGDLEHRAFVSSAACGPLAAWQPLTLLGKTIYPTWRTHSPTGSHL